MIRGVLASLAVFLVLSVALSALWPRVVTVLAGWADEPAARLLLATNDDVISSDHTRDGERVVVLEGGGRRRLWPVLARTTSLAVPVFLSLAAAAFTWAPARERLACRRGVVVLAAAAVGVVAAEVLTGWLAIGYAFAVATGSTPGTALRIATVTANAARGFVPFAAVVLAVWAGRSDGAQRTFTTRTASPSEPTSSA